MSSPEAHSDTPKDPDIEPNLKEYLEREGGYAYSAETDDGDSSPEIVPYDPELDEDTEDARDALRNAKIPIRHMYQAEINRAISDLQIQANADKKAKPHLDLNQKALDAINQRIDERQKIVNKLRQELDAKNDKGKGYKTSTNRLRWHEEKLRNLQKEKQKVEFRRERIVDKRDGSIPDSPDRKTEAHRRLRDNLRNIDKEIERRREIQAKLEDPDTDEESKRLLEQEIDRWPRNDDGEIETEEQLRARLIWEAGDAYSVSLQHQAEREKIMRFENAYEKITSEQFTNFDLAEDEDADSAERQRAIIELTKLPELRNSLIDESEMDEFKAWVKKKADTEKARDIAKATSNDKYNVVLAREKRAQADEKAALEAINNVVEGLKKLSSRAEVLKNQLDKLTLQADEIQQNMKPVTDPVARAQLQEALNKVEAEMAAVFAEHQEIVDKIDTEKESQISLNETYNLKKTESANAIRATAKLRDKLNKTIERNYLNKLRIAGL